MTERRVAHSGDAGGARWSAGTVLTLPFVGAIRLYQVTLGPLMGGHCRFEPSCSRYALEAYQRFGPVKGTWLTIWRVSRCHPLGGSGYDPVPLHGCSRVGKQRK